MQIQSVSPAPDFRDLIREFSFINIEPSAISENDHIVIDDGCYDFVFFKGAGTSFSHGGSNNIKITNSAFTIHQLKPPNKLIFNSEIELFVAKVQPWTNALFFPPAFDPGIINLKRIFSSKIEQLYQDILMVDQFADKVTLFEAFIQSLRIEKSPTLLIVKSICEKIYETQGAIKVNELVDLFKLNRQLLNKKFKSQVHYTIKQFIVIVRIMSLIKYKIDHPQESLTSVAYRFEYTDQAHFNNDFKKVCGISPLSFFKNLPIFFQRHKK